MKRDMNIVRQIISQIAESESKYFEGPFDFEEEVSKELLDYHIEIMREAGIIDGYIAVADGDTIVIYSLYLSWLGNDFYETFKDDNVWERAKSFVKSRELEIANIPFDILMELGKKMLKDTFSI